MRNTVWLLTAAGVLMLIAGTLFCFTKQWSYAVLVWIGAFGCLAAALHFKSGKDL